MMILNETPTVRNILLNGNKARHGLATIIMKDYENWIILFFVQIGSFVR